MSRLILPLAIAATLAATSQIALAQPDAAAALLDTYRSSARLDEAGFRDFSIQRGQQLFLARHGDLSCASCHTDNPKAAGRHAKTGKTIEPLAPVANANRLSDPAKVEKWFKRNCNDVLARACSAKEKGDFVTWLVAVK